MFHIRVAKVDRDVAKVDRGVAHVAMAMHICFKCMFQMFHLYQTYVAIHLDVVKVDLDVAYTCMFQVFQVFHTFVASVLSGCCIGLQ